MSSYQMLIDPSSGDTDELVIDTDAFVLTVARVGGEERSDAYDSLASLTAAYQELAASRYALGWVDNDTDSERFLDFDALAERETFADRVEVPSDDLDALEVEMTADVVAAIVAAVRQNAEGPYRVVKVGRGEFEFANISLDGVEVLASDTEEDNAMFFSWEESLQELREALGQEGDLQPGDADTMGARIGARVERADVFPKDVSARLAPGYVVHVCAMDDAPGDAEREDAIASLPLPLTEWLTRVWS